MGLLDYFGSSKSDAQPVVSATITDATNNDDFMRPNRLDARQSDAPPLSEAEEFMSMFDPATRDALRKGDVKIVWASAAPGTEPTAASQASQGPHYHPSNPSMPANTLPSMYPSRAPQYAPWRQSANQQPALPPFMYGNPVQQSQLSAFSSELPAAVPSGLTGGYGMQPTSMSIPWQPQSYAAPPAWNTSVTTQGSGYAPSMPIHFQRPGQQAAPQSMWPMQSGAQYTSALPMWQQQQQQQSNIPSMAFGPPSVSSFERPMVPGAGQGGFPTHLTSISMSRVPTL